MATLTLDAAVNVDARVNVGGIDDTDQGKWTEEATCQAEQYIAILYICRLFSDNSAEKLLITHRTIIKAHTCYNKNRGKSKSRAYFLW